MTLKSYKDEEKQRQSNWVREIVQDTCPVEEYVLETIKNRYVYLTSVIYKNDPLQNTKTCHIKYFNSWKLYC